MGYPYSWVKTRCPIDGGIYTVQYNTIQYNTTGSINLYVSGSSVGFAPAWYADGRWLDPHVRQHSFVEFGHEIILAAILSLPFKKAVVSYWRKNEHYVLVGGLPRNSVDRFTDRARKSVEGP